MNFETPVADLDRPPPRLGLTIPFSNSQFDITSPLLLTIAPLGGTITIVHNVVMIAQGSNQLAVMDFNAGAPDVTVVLDAASVTLLNSLLAAVGLSITQVQNMLAGVSCAASASRYCPQLVGQLMYTPLVPDLMLNLIVVVYQPPTKMALLNDEVSPLSLPVVSQ